MTAEAIIAGLALVWTVIGSIVAVVWAAGRAKGKSDAPNADVTALSTSIELHRAESKNNALETKAALVKIEGKVDRQGEIQAKQGGALELLDERTRGHGVDIGDLRRRVSGANFRAADPREETPTIREGTGRYKPVKP